MLTYGNAELVGLGSAIVGALATWLVMRPWYNRDRKGRFTSAPKE